MAAPRCAARCASRARYPLLGPAWFETGGICAHDQTMVVEREPVRAFVQQPVAGAQLVTMPSGQRRPGGDAVEGRPATTVGYRFRP